MIFIFIKKAVSISCSSTTFHLYLKEYHVRVVLTRNHIPVARVRMRKGISWRDFAEVLKRSVDAGVIVR